MTLIGLLQTGISRIPFGVLAAVSWIPAFAGRLRASLPSRRIQDFLSINDGGVVVRHLPGMAKGLSGWQPAFSLPVVIPAQAGIQWFRQAIPARAGMTTRGMTLIGLLQTGISRVPFGVLAPFPGFQLSLE